MGSSSKEKSRYKQRISVLFFVVIVLILIIPFHVRSAGTPQVRRGSEV